MGHSCVVCCAYCRPFYGRASLVVLFASYLYFAYNVCGVCRLKIFFFCFAYLMFGRTVSSISNVDKDAARIAKKNDRKT